MITMISCPNFESLKTKNGENPFAASPTADFAALFTAPVCATATDSSFLKNGAIVQTENCQDAFSPETNLDSTDENILSAEPEIQLPQIIRLPVFNNQTKSDFQTTGKTAFFDKAELLIENTIDNALTETGKARANEKNEKNEFSNYLPDFFVAISKVFKTENNLTAEHEIQTADLEIYTAQNVPQPIFNNRAESNFQPESKIGFSDEAEALVKNGIENGLLEIVSSEEEVKITNLTSVVMSEPNTSRAKEKEEFSNNLPDFFVAMAKVFKSENSVAPEKSDFSVDFDLTGNVFREPQTVSKTELNFPENAEINFSQPKKALSEAENLSLDAKEAATVNFNKFTATLPKEQMNVEDNVQAPVTAQEVLEQIEPQTLYLASLTVKENEKKVMKMRLHPAELGMVEIILEKGSSGNLNAHFQTESEATRQILTENINELRQSLEDSGWQIEQLEITCAAFSSNEGNESESGRGKQAKEFQTAENQPDGTASFADRSDGNNSDDKNDFKRNQSNRFVSLRA